MAPIRVGLIGLGATDSAAYRPGEWGVQHMKAINSSPSFELVAVANSSVESAQRSIKAHNLPATVKAYGSPEDMARDPNVDLVAVVVDVQKHAVLVKPALEQKKTVLVEFPVAPTASGTEEIARLAKESGVTVLVGSQGRAAPELRKLKELVQTKAIGDVVSSSFTGQIPAYAKAWPAAYSFYLDLKPGATRMTVTLGHILDAFVNVLGQPKSIQSLLKVQDKTATLIDNDGNVVDPAYKVTAPDTILFQGILENNAVANFALRSPTATADGVGFRWTISGTEGELVLTTGPGVLHMGSPDAKILLRKWSGETEEVDFSREEKIGDLVGFPASVARLYEAFAAGEKDAYTTIEQSLVTEKLVDEITRTAVWAH